MEATVSRGGWYWPVNRRVNPSVVRLDWYSLPRSGKSARIQHPFWVLDYSQDATIRTRVGSGRASWLERGAQVAHLYPPGTAYWEWPVRDGVVSGGGYVVFHFENDDSLRDFFLKRSVYARIADPDGVIGLRLQEGARAVEQTSGLSSFWMAQSALCAVLGVIAGAHRAGDGNWVVCANRGGVPEGLVAQVEAHLLKHLAEPVGLDEMARALHVSRSSLSHRYNELTGTSPMQALLRLRIEQAKRLLVRGHKLDDIAGQCGFYDAAHVSRVFQAKTGQSPRRFARMQ